MLEKTIRLNALYDFYHPLLTLKQQEYMSHYYQDDLTLSEIALECNVSRQAVYDTIRRTEILLEEYEEKLKLYKKFTKRQKLIEQLRHVVVNNKNRKITQELIEQLEQLD